MEAKERAKVTVKTKVAREKAKVVPGQDQESPHASKCVTKENAFMVTNAGSATILRTQAGRAVLSRKQHPRKLRKKRKPQMPRKPKKNRKRQPPKPKVKEAEAAAKEEVVEKATANNQRSLVKAVQVRRQPAEN